MTTEQICLQIRFQIGAGSYQPRVAELYAELIKPPMCTDVREINQAIIKRWSRSGLIRIKKMAWNIVYPKELK